MAITAGMVKELRELTGAGMMDCKKALAETNGNMEEAITWLREKGISKAAKKQTRIAAEGLATAKINGNDAVLVEGAGGLMVPLTEDNLTIDYVQESGYPLVFVTSGRLGSINHTLLSFEAIERRGIKLHTVMYNLFPEGEDKIIQADTETYICRYIEKHFPDTAFVKVPCL